MHSPIGAGHEASIGEDKLKTIHRRYVTQIIQQHQNLPRMAQTMTSFGQGA